MDTAVRGAYECIIHCLQQHRWREGDVLPPLSALAHEAGVSRSSMWKALQTLKREKRLSVKEGGKIRVGVSIPHTPSPTTLAARITSDLLKKINEGAYRRTGLLPSAGELCTIYHTGYATIRKVIAHLTAEGVIFPHGRRFHIGRTSHYSFRLNLVLITAGDENGITNLSIDRMTAIISSFEQECYRMGINPVILRYNIADPAMNRTVHTVISKVASLGGILVNKWWIELPRVRKMFEELLEELQRYHVPLALFDDTADTELPPAVANKPNFRTFTISDHKAGECIGDYLMKHGHRSAAFISQFHRRLWSVRRLRGLEERLHACGASVKPYTIDELDDFIDITFRFNDDDRETLRRLYARELSPELSTELDTMMKAAVAAHPPDARIGARIRPVMQMLKILTDADIPKADFIRLMELLLASMQQIAEEILLRPLFDKCLADESITAWVCSNDGTALHALNYLHEKRIEVPRRISVVGFDNTLKALDRGLTSVDFNFPRLVSSMIDFCLGRKEYSSWSQGASVEIPCYCVERTSTIRSH